MSKEYYLIPKELIDSRIEELEKYIKLTEEEIEQHESIETYDRDENWEDKLDEFESNKDSQMGALVSLIRFKDLITQQSELVEVKEYWQTSQEIPRIDKYHGLSGLKNWIEEQGFKLIKTITK